MLLHYLLRQLLREPCQRPGATLARGVVMRRARIVSEPVTDYIRWEHAVTPLNLDAGEQVRWLPRRHASDIPLPGNDFWLIDGRLAMFHFFTGDGDWADHRRFVVLMEESALRYRTANPEDMAGHLRHLLAVMPLASVSLRIIPFTAQRTPVAPGGVLPPR
jgi:hypothetical protein